MGKAIQELVPDHMGISLGGFGVSLGGTQVYITRAVMPARQAGTWWGHHSEFLLPNQPQMTLRDLFLFPFLCSKVLEIATGFKSY